VSAILILIGVGVLLLAALALLDIICTIIAMVKANDGIAYQYPLTIRFLK
jgi:uncharacterized Tic20 family protein